MIDKKDNKKYPKIPILPDMTSWKKVEILESGEQLIALNELKTDRLIEEGQYYLQGITNSIRKCFVRRTVAKMLIEASIILPNYYRLVIWDAWRPIETQKAIFDSYIARLKTQYPLLGEEQLTERVQKYVTLPSFDEKNPPPHCTGGAIDVSIADQSGMPLNMGTHYDDFSEKAETRYYETKIEKGELLSDVEMIILNNRRLLFHTLESVGFSNYPAEWWHYDYGNQFWGKNNDIRAIYGRISLKDMNINHDD